MIQKVEKYYDDFGVYTNTYMITYTDGSLIQAPHDTANRHYQEILEWVANGGTIVDTGA